MAIDLKIIREKGGTVEKLKPLFTSDKPSDKVKALRKLLASRIDDGISTNLKYARFWKAIDEAFEVAQRQTTYTLAREFLNRKVTNREDVLKAAHDWGLDSLLWPALDPNAKPEMDSEGNEIYRFDLPTFFNIHVPVVAAYLKIREARLFNDRDTYPLYRYDPLKLTMKERLKCDIITDRIQRTSTEMGYRSTLRQVIHQACLYGVSVKFPMEDWYTEKQLATVEGKKKEIVVKEGIRWATPHPWRTFYDLDHPLTSVNSDTGCKWYGFWDIMPYREVLNSNTYWNIDKIAAAYGPNHWLKSDAWRLYQEFYPCRFTFPTLSSGDRGAGQSDRINERYYSKSEEDQAVALVSMFAKLNPKQWGLYDYDYDVWHWFVMAGEDTVLYCSPIAYTPGTAYLYDHDSSRAFNNSLALELIPWQDHLGNYLTQYLLSVKQNLGRVVFVNQDLLQEKYILQIKNLGEKMYRATNFVPYSPQEWSWQKQTAADVFHTPQFPQVNTSEIANAINTMILVMERMLGFSHLEIGAPSTHEESATESGFKQQSISVRLDYTGSFIDDGISADKRQLYDAHMAYSSDEVMSQVADMNDAKKAALEEMGFEIEEEADGQRTKAGVKGDKKALVVTGFVSEREGRNRVNDPKLAATMVQTFQAMFSNPAIVQATGIGQLIEMFNQILYYAGMPDDFRLRFDPKAAQETQVAAVQEQLGQAAQAIAQQAQQIAAQTTQAILQQEMVKLADGLKSEVIAPLQQQQQQFAAAIGQLAQHAQASDQKDGVQDEAIARIAQLFQAAIQPQPVPYP